ncbi:MAG: hypothetical protein H7067_05835 [Burkholderiales bacterium]|nr:hypothetical protein [Opitutaceae bacterium]
MPVLAGFAVVLGAAPVEIEFASVDASGDPVRVSLVDATTKEREWVKVGGRFAGCEVRAYDAGRQMLKLARGEETWEVALQAGVIAKAGLSEEERAGIEKQVLNNLRQLTAAADQYFLEHGVSTVKIDQLVGTGPSHYIKALKPADGEDYAVLDLTQTGAPQEWFFRTSRGVEVRYTRQ